MKIEIEAETQRTLPKAAVASPQQQQIKKNGENGIKITSNDPNISIIIP